MFRLFPTYRLLPLIFVLAISSAFAQPVNYSTANAHSHNDYENAVPFRAAYEAGFGSIEADIFLEGDQLIVAHDREGVKQQRTLEALYLKPLANGIREHNGHVYADPGKPLQLLIDIKTEAIPTLAKLVSLLRQYPDLTACKTLKCVISGNRPDPATFNTYPDFIWFDGELNKTYTTNALTKVALFSDNLRNYTAWKGYKSSIPETELQRLQQSIQRSHSLGKPIRFWNAPDSITAWYQFMDLKVDFINTDRISDMAAFLDKLGATSFTSTFSNHAYQPTYKSDGATRKVKNIILLIGDGTGLAQWYAGYTANKGQLNVFRMRHIGLSKTSSHDNFVTDSAPGSTAFSSGEKTNNRYVGVDHTGAPLTLLPMILAMKKIRTGLVTCGDITDATPADFYAHRMDRDSSAAIFTDLGRSPVQFVWGAGNKSFTPAIQKQLEDQQFHVTTSIDSVPLKTVSKWVVLDDRAGRSVLGQRGNWLPDAFSKALQVLGSGESGFFLMTEGAQIDYGGHGNNLPYVATEVIDFDEVVGRALQFADANGETLVIVTADHETGGLSLLDGNYSTGSISGQFATGHHTAMPVPVFAYGPQAQLFQGVYENTALFGKMLKALGIN
ncbi:alkaline phosphatase [Flavihumibacter petaseus]|uniref:Putative phosphatase n=1 Tax=Flavihumibacter petaseus NBRC 106054 TaxID=1220578 RepID=A0A0E9N2I1_9BACT|nr:alkaline phosphatase [Flavihumibacter petaseus]GAO44049.1 putative phosphatase [Flavihumibacter petaseus NBRC 106054]